MKKKITVIALVYLLLSLFVLTGCTPSAQNTTANISIGFKQTGNAGSYDESLSVFTIGSRMYIAVNVQILTNLQRNTSYIVEIIIPRTDYIITDPQGGLDEDKQESISGGYKLTYTVMGSKNAAKEKMLFSAVPYSEGSAEIKVTIYTADGEKVKGYSHTVFFEF